MPRAAPSRWKPLPVGVPLLQNGDHLSAGEFLRRYEAMPDLKKAELLDGTVYLMASPVRLDQHGEPDNLIQTWLGTYIISTRGVKAATNSTTRLGPDDVPQPDGLLRILPEFGGRSKLDAKGYLQGPPELAVEIAASSASLDAWKKQHVYRRAGIQEYLLWRTEEGRVDWWVLEGDDYVPLATCADGILRSRVFPGLWLDVEALLNEDGAQLMSVLRRGIESAEHAAFLKKLVPMG